MRSFDSEITVNSEGKWINQHGQEILNEEIVTYFKKNLRFVDGQHFIYNKFGELEERGSVVLNGFPWVISQIYWTREGAAEAGPIQESDEAQSKLPPIYAQLDTGKVYPVQLTEFKLWLPDTLWVELMQTPCRVSSGAMVQLGELMMEKAGKWYWDLSSQDEAPEGIRTVYPDFPLIPVTMKEPFAGKSSSMSS